MLESNTGWLALLVALFGYGIGCLNTGYYLVRWRTGQDIRTLGSGNAGARNVGRVLGRSGFALTLAGDLLKGALGVLVARGLGLPEWAWVMALLAAVAGHLWPIQLRGRGGKGAATALGGLVAISPLLGLGMVVVAIVMRLITRHTVAAGVVAAALAPLIGWWIGLSSTLLTGIGVLLLLLCFTHRDNLRRLLPGKQSS